MKYYSFLFLLCTCITVTGCGKTEGQHSINQVSANQNYERYSGTWTERGISHDRIISDGGTEFRVTITNARELNGYLYTQQSQSDRFAEIYDITGSMEDNEFYYNFTDDGWGGSGTLHIQFQEDKINIEVQNYRMDDKNLSGFGISGAYQLERTDAAVINEEPDVQTSEQNLSAAIYDKYYSKWSEDEMLTAINERSIYLEDCSFYQEVSEYMETVREVRDISIAVEPLYDTDMKYYRSQDFKNVPPLIIHLAKNEIYARHGYIFRDKNLNNYFMGQIWYEPSCTPENFDDSVFNVYETANLKVLVNLDSYNKN